MEYSIAASGKKPEIEYSVSRDLTSTLKLVGIDVWDIPAWYGHDPAGHDESHVHRVEYFKSGKQKKRRIDNIIPAEAIHRTSWGR